MPNLNGIQIEKKTYVERRVFWNGAWIRGTDGQPVATFRFSIQVSRSVNTAWNNKIMNRYISTLMNTYFKEFI